MGKDKIAFARPYFEREPEQEKAYITKDPVTGELQFLFWREDNAATHAKNLREKGFDGTVVEVTREECAPGGQDDKKSAEPSKKELAEAALAKAVAKREKAAAKVGPLEQAATDANNALAALPAGAKAKDKTKAEGAAKKAADALAKAKAELETAEGDVAAAQAEVENVTAEH